MAARIGAMFSIDPIRVLDSDHFEWTVRLAAYNVAVDDRNKAQAKAARKK